MRSKTINKSINILLLLIFISHLTVFHNVLDSYVICYGSDGHIAIEDQTECDDCSVLQFNNFTNSVELSAPHCEDVALNQNCFEEEEFITKDKIVFTPSFVVLTTTFENYISIKEIYQIKFNDELENQILENYTSVSLLI